MLGEVLREARNAAGMTQEELAYAAQVDRTYISQIENDKKSPTVDMLFRLCEAMNASPAKLIAKVEKRR